MSVAVGAFDTQGQIGRADQIAFGGRPAGAGRRLAELQLFRRPSRQHRHEKLLEIVACGKLQPSGHALRTTAVAADRERFRHGRAEREVRDRMAGFVVGDAETEIGGQVGFAAADRADNILHGHVPASLARRLAGHADPLFHVGPGMSAPPRADRRQRSRNEDACGRCRSVRRRRAARL